MVISQLLERVARALPFNCPFCEVGIGKLCVNKNGQPMARYVHPEREPIDVMQSAYSRMILEDWFAHNGGIFQET